MTIGNNMTRRFALFLLPALLLLFSFGCDDCPQCPSSDVTIGYTVALRGLNLAEEVVDVYLYNTESRELFDTLFLTGIRDVLDIALTADGSRLCVLYIAWQETEDGEWIYGFEAYDVRDQAKVCSLGVRAGKIEVSSSGRYMALCSSDSIYLLDGQSLDVISGIAQKANECRFLPDDSRLYVVDRSNRIYVYDPARAVLIDTIEYRDNDGYAPGLYDLQPNSDGSKIYLFARYSSYTGYLCSYVVESDSTVLQYFFHTAGTGDIRLTANGRQIIATDPGYQAIEDFGTGDVYFIDTRTDVIIAIVPASRSIGGQIPIGFYAGEIALTPDGRYTIVSSTGFPIFGMIDNSLHRFVDLHQYSIGEISFVHVSCQQY